MRFKIVIQCALAICVACGIAACTPRPYIVSGPGCRIDIYTAPNLQGYGLSIMQDAAELAPGWNNTAESAKVIYGTWRLYADAGYKEFMGDYKAPADIVQIIPSRKLASLKCTRPEPPPS